MMLSNSFTQSLQRFWKVSSSRTRRHSHSLSISAEVLEPRAVLTDVVPGTVLSDPSAIFTGGEPGVGLGIPPLPPIISFVLTPTTDSTPPILPPPGSTLANPTAIFTDPPLNTGFPTLPPILTTPTLPDPTASPGIGIVLTDPSTIFTTAPDPLILPDGITPLPAPAPLVPPLSTTTPSIVFGTAVPTTPIFIAADTGTSIDGVTLIDLSGPAPGISISTSVSLSIDEIISPDGTIAGVITAGNATANTGVVTGLTITATIMLDGTPILQTEINTPLIPADGQQVTVGPVLEF